MSFEPVVEDADALLRSAEQMLDRGLVQSAGALFERAELAGASPDRCAAGRWMCAMYHGELGAAWKESDAIRARGAPDPHRFWNGEPIRNRRLMVRCLHGFGDTVQMLRYAPWLRDQCATVVFEVPSPLLEIAYWFDGVEEAITWGEAAPIVQPGWDLQCEVTELPYIFRTTLQDLPIATNYLRVPGAEKPLLDRTVRRPRVGIVWAAGEWNPSRSLPFSTLRELVAAPGVEFWNLQGGARQNEWASLGDAANLCDARDYGREVGVLASIIRELDLVITVDTLAAHLAGAIGVPAWVLLQHVADWRWMRERRDTPWYSSLRLYRQISSGDWATLLAEVKKDLACWLTHFHREERVG